MREYVGEKNMLDVGEKNMLVRSGPEGIFFSFAFANENSNP